MVDFICSKHFEESDFFYHTNDTKNRRKRKLQKEKLKYRYVKKRAYVSNKIFNVPFLSFKTEACWKTFFRFLRRKKEDFSSKNR